MEKPIINEVFADNGEHSHWELINAETGELLWSEDTFNEYIPTDDTIEEVLKHIPKYFAFDKASGQLYNCNSQLYEGIDGDMFIQLILKVRRENLKVLLRVIQNIKLL